MSRRSDNLLMAVLAADMLYCAWRAMGRPGARGRKRRSSSSGPDAGSPPEPAAGVRETAEPPRCIEDRHSPR